MIEAEREWESTQLFVTFSQKINIITIKQHHLVRICTRFQEGIIFGLFEWVISRMLQIEHNYPGAHCWLWWLELKRGEFMRFQKVKSTYAVNEAMQMGATFTIFVFQFQPIKPKLSSLELVEFSPFSLIGCKIDSWGKMSTFFVMSKEFWTVPFFEQKSYGFVCLHNVLISDIYLHCDCAHNLHFNGSPVRMHSVDGEEKYYH